jgi:phosphatidylglycerol---prolipoprotein diacylglyceryl transferase
MKPILWQLGPFTLRYYGLMYALALLAAIFLIRSDLRHKKVLFDEDQLLNTITLTFLAGIIGARIYYVLFNLDYYLAYPSEILAVWHGGLAIHGGIIAGFICGYLLARKYRFPVWSLADSGSLAVILGQAIGRWGNFFNGDAYGLPTKQPWGIIFPPDSPAGSQFPGIPTHPVMIYESLLNLLAFALLFYLSRKKKLPDGSIFALYLCAYAVVRFGVSFFRADDLMIGIFRAPHLISLFGLLLGLYLLNYFRRKN